MKVDNTKVSEEAHFEPRRLLRLVRLFERGLDKAGHRPRSLMIGLAVGTFLLSALAGAKETQIPFVHDEFSFLLAAETFSEGRLTNDPHPHWEHFETFHVIAKPTYQSKFPPAPALFMALGLLVSGQAIVGVWIAGGLAVAATFWMLLAWLPRKWAVLGGVIAAFHPGIILIWGQSYWGGSVGLLGGALVLGGVRRLFTDEGHKGAFFLALGLTLLAHTRPFEGLMLVVAIGSMLIAAKLFKIRTGRRQLQLSPLVLLGSLGLLGLLTVGYYNWRLTGDPLTFAHRLWSETYTATGIDVANPRLAAYRGSEPGTMATRLERLVWFYFGLWLALPFFLQGWRFERLTSKVMLVLTGSVLVLAIIPGANIRPLGALLALIALQAIATMVRSRDFWIWFALLICCAVVGVSSTYTRAWPHYVAPVAPLFFFLIVRALRDFRALKLKRVRCGRALYVAIPAIALSFTIVDICRHPRDEELIWSRPWTQPTPLWAKVRFDIIQEFEAMEEEHLFFVRYPSWYPTDMEWVQNGAKIDQTRIVWAHELGSEKNLGMMEYFPERSVWLLDLGTRPMRIMPLRSVSSRSREGSRGGGGVE